MPNKPRGGRRGANGAQKAKKATPKPTQRKIPFNPTIADQICVLLADGKSLRKICAMPGMVSKTTVLLWLGDPDNAAFVSQYARAREAQADTLADEIVDIADEASGDFIETEDGGVKLNAEAVMRSRLRVDARKWYASKLAPKKYGDRQEIEHSGAVKHTHLTLEEFDARYKAAGLLE